MSWFIVLFMLKRTTISFDECSFFSPILYIIYCSDCVFTLRRFRSWEREEKEAVASVVKWLVTARALRVITVGVNNFSKLRTGRARAIFFFSRAVVTNEKVLFFSNYRSLAFSSAWYMDKMSCYFPFWWFIITLFLLLVSCRVRRCCMKDDRRRYRT